MCNEILRIVAFHYGTNVKVLNPLNFWVGSIAYHKFSYSCDTLNISVIDVKLG